MGAYVIPKLEVIEYSTELLVQYIQSSHDIAAQCTISHVYRSYSRDVPDYPDMLWRELIYKLLWQVYALMQ